MKLSISNIGWSMEDDEDMYGYLRSIGFEGIEIAPTRIFHENPYDRLEEAEKYAIMLKKQYDLEIPSMQSIWFGRTEKIFSSFEERESLIDYTKKAIDFASTMKCGNLVFGCPKNRNINSEKDMEIAKEFFDELGNYAIPKNTIIAIEPNPIIYNTNFINTTAEAFKFVESLNNNGVKVNVDLGTIINNDEDIKIIKDNIKYVNHIHISEPYLEKIQKRYIHRELANILKSEKYNKCISIEMKNLNDIEVVKETINYIKEVFK